MAAQSGIKIVMASHDLGQVRRLAGEVIFLVRGAICERAPAADFLDHPATPEAAAFLRTLRSRNVRLLCDLFHMGIEEPDPADALRSAGPLVGHVHFADSNRQAIGWGHTNMVPIMAALRDIDYAGYLSAEVLPLPDSVLAARQAMESFRHWTAV